MQSHEATQRGVAATPHVGHGEFYKLDLTRLSFREIRNCAPNAYALLPGVLSKVFRLSRRARYGFAPEAASILELGEVPRHVVDACEEAVQACEDQNFVRRFATTFPVLGDQEWCTIMLANRERTVLAKVDFTRLEEAVSVSVSLISILADGRVFSTTNARPALDLPAGFEPVRRLAATPAELVKWHAGRLREISVSRPLEMDDVAQRQVCLDMIDQAFEFNRSRGAWTRMQPEEVERLRGETRGAS